MHFKIEISREAKWTKTSQRITELEGTFVSSSNLR